MTTFLSSKLKCPYIHIVGGDNREKHQGNERKSLAVFKLEIIVEIKLCILSSLSISKPLPDISPLTIQ